MSRLKVSLGKIELKNPVITASGTFGNGQEMSKIFDLNKLGAITTKAITLRPTAGNPYPRVCETPSGIINTIGLQNQGIDNFLKEDAKLLKELDTIIIANVAGKTNEEYIKVCRKLEDAAIVDILEINISCPNVKAGGMSFGNDENLASNLITDIKKSVNLPVYAKLTPNDCDIIKIAKAVESAGADGISMINTILAMSIDPSTLISKISCDYGGLSGPAIKPIALRMVHQAASNVNIPVIGMGGICSGDDAVEFLSAGASAISIGTATMINPDATLNIINELNEYLEKNNTTISEIIGSYKGAS